MTEEQDQEFEEGYIQISSDKVDWGNFLFAPQFVIGMDGSYIPVFIGNSKDENFENSVGLYVRESDYFSIDHTKKYIFINNPEPDYEIVNSMIKEIKEDEFNDEEESNQSINLGVTYEKGDEISDMLH